MKAKYWGYNYYFKRPAGTSRGVMTQKPCYFIEVTCDGVTGRGECGILPGLSIDNLSKYENKLKELCTDLSKMDSNKWKFWAENNGPDDIWYSEYQLWPSIILAIELALMQWKSITKTNLPWNLFDTAFTRKELGIPINGLLWMGDKCYLNDQIEARLLDGYHCIKMKIGALDFKKEIMILKTLRHEQPNIEIRVDANGAYSSETALMKMDLLKDIGIHSMEQPCQPKDIKSLKLVSSKGEVSTALDESLIGVTDEYDRDYILDEIKPDYIVLKPSLLGGFKSCKDWIHRAEIRGIGWWITSALEGNEGLAGIAQWASSLEGLKGFQGFGTGALYRNNTTPLTEVRKGEIWML